MTRTHPLPTDAQAPHMYVCSPAGAVQDRRGFRRGITRLQQYTQAQVQVDEAALSRYQQRFAGDDATRVQALQRAVDSGSDWVLLSRGGYGITRIMDVIPWQAIAHRIVHHGQMWLGYSDFTALQMGLLVQDARAYTWAGPLVAADLGAQSPDPITLACFEDVLQGQSEGTGWTLPKAAGLALHDLAQQPQHHALNHRLQQAQTEGLTGRLWGGNLCVLSKLVGTPWLPSMPHGLLFLEDVAEAPYSIERMLSQLEWAGILAQQQAIILGQFSGAQATEAQFGMTQVIDRLRTRMAALGVPVFTHLPFGHTARKVCLPVGAPVSLQWQGRDVLLLWDCPLHADALAASPEHRHGACACAQGTAATST